MPDLDHRDVVAVGSGQKPIWMSDQGNWRGGFSVATGGIVTGTEIDMQ